MTPEEVEALLAGTCNDEVEGMDTEDAINTMIDLGYEKCPECEWWVESCELYNEDDEPCSCDSCGNNIVGNPEAIPDLDAIFSDVDVVETTGQVTKYIKLKVYINGCFCDEECPFFNNACYFDPLKDAPLLGNPLTDMLDAPIVNYDAHDKSEMWIRTRECCALFGYTDDDGHIDPWYVTPDEAATEPVTNRIASLEDWMNE